VLYFQDVKPLLMLAVTGVSSVCAHHLPGPVIKPSGIVASAGWTYGVPVGDGFSAIARMLRALRSSTSSTVYSAATSQWMFGSSGPYPWG